MLPSCRLEEVTRADGSRCLLDNVTDIHYTVSLAPICKLLIEATAVHIGDSVHIRVSELTLEVAVLSVLKPEQIEVWDRIITELFSHNLNEIIVPRKSEASFSDKTELGHTVAKFVAEAGLIREKSCKGITEILL